MMDASKESEGVEGAGCHRARKVTCCTASNLLITAPTDHQPGGRGFKGTKVQGDKGSRGRRFKGTKVQGAMDLDGGINLRGGNCGTGSEVPARSSFA